MIHSEPAAMSHGQLRVVTTYLEMKQPPARAPAKPPIEGLSIKRERPTVSESELVKLPAPLDSRSVRREADGVQVPRSPLHFVVDRFIIRTPY